MSVESNGVGWRFADDACSLSASEIETLCFLGPEQSRLMWECLVSSEAGHLMELGKWPGAALDSQTLDFDLPASGKLFFGGLCSKDDLIVFFWSADVACIVRGDLLVKAWDDFFYPSDESSVAVVMCSRLGIASFEDRFVVLSLSD